jgi:hypothetical protein
MAGKLLPISADEYKLNFRTGKINAQTLSTANLAVWTRWTDSIGSWR